MLIHKKKWASYVSNSEMSDFFVEQGCTKVYAETYFLYVAGKNLRRTPLNGKIAIYGWTLINDGEDGK